MTMIRSPRAVPSPMRICFIVYGYPHHGWPACGSYAYNLSRDLKHPSLFVTKDLGDEPLPFPQHTRLRAFSYPEPGVPEKMTGLTLLWVGVGKAVGLAIFLAKALPHIVKFRPQIIHAYATLPLMLGVVGKWILGAPLVLTFEGTDYRRFKASRLLQSVVRKWVDTVICVSSDIQKGASERLPGKRVLYVPTGVDSEIFSDSGMPRKEQLVVVGRLVWQKGLEYLLDAVKLVVALKPDVRLLIVGDGPLRGEVEESIEAMGLSKNVTLTGVLPHSEITKLLNESRVFVLSSVSEGLPRALLEAMACGTPVVVTDVGDCALAAKDAGVVVAPRDSEALANAVLRILDDASLWRSASRRGRKKAEQYTWEARSKTVLGEYERLLEGSGQMAATH